jgi:hypothetical protein
MLSSKYPGGNPEPFRWVTSTSCTGLSGVLIIICVCQAKPQDRYHRKLGLIRH